MISSKICRGRKNDDQPHERDGATVRGVGVRVRDARQAHAATAHRVKRAPTMQATLQMSALGPHFAPRITSGQRYCLVWMSSVKWCSTQVAANVRRFRCHVHRIRARTVAQVGDLNGDLLGAVIDGMQPTRAVHGHRAC